MIGTAVLDAYHMLVTAGAALWLMPADHATTGPWSWFGSRMFLSLLLLWSWTTWRRENRSGWRGLSDFRIYLEVGAVTLLSITLFGVVPLPAAVRIDSIVARPFELLPGAIFAAATVGYLFKGNWRNRPFEVWLIPALLISVAIQWLFIPFSASPFDAFATVSYALKLVSYGCILMGLLASMYGLYQRLERSSLLIAHRNEALSGEVVDRKAAEQEARKSEEKYRTILETIQEGYFELDLAGNLVFWNESLATLLGYRSERLAGLNYRAYTRPGQSGAVFETFSQVYRSSQPVEAFGWEIIRPDGTRRYGEASAGPIRGEVDEIIGIRGIVRDVTARREAEKRLEAKSRELARSNEELRQFADITSRDLQAPLQTVAGYTQLLERRCEGKMGEDTDLLIRRTVEGVDRMQRLIRDLLDYSSVHTHGAPFESVSLDAALGSVLALLQPDIERTQATVTADPLPEVQGDLAQMGRLLRNLIENALKFRGERPPEIHIGAHKRGGEWQITVRDNGIGVDPGNRGRIFELFQRLDKPEEAGGTGVGLAICRRIVERHGGRIWMEPTPGRGATFVFTLPRQVASVAEKASVAVSGRRRVPGEGP